MIHPWDDPDPSEPLPRRVRRYKIERYLASLHCVIWPAGHFDVSDPKERAAAVKFLEDIMDSLGMT